MLSSFEIQPGLAMVLDPGSMPLAKDACTDPRGRVPGPHFFICVEVRGEISDWVATSSRSARGRVRVRRKWGHPTWVLSDTFADIFQVWTLELEVVRRASTLDRSRRTQRNYASLDFLYDEECAAA